MLEYGKKVYSGSTGWPWRYRCNYPLHSKEVAELVKMNDSAVCFYAYTEIREEGETEIYRFWNL